MVRHFLSLLDYTNDELRELLGPNGSKNSRRLERFISR